MPLFQVPGVPSSLTPLLRARPHSQRSGKKRKRTSSPESDFDDDDREINPEPDQSKASSLEAASINPLSLTPDEILQYKTAGLDLGQALPSKSIPDFPHRGFPSSISVDVSGNHDRGRADSATEEEARGGMTYGSKLRMRHLGVLTTVLHHCLLQGDILRASRAWALLLRSQVRGRGIDIRNSGYWGIGAELLIRAGEKPAEGWETSTNTEERSEAEEREEDDDANHQAKEVRAEEVVAEEVYAEQVEVEEDSKKDVRNHEPRWGTAAGLEMAKDYYERLILQYQYTRQFPNSVNSLDFWPAMLGCEIYGIQYEQKAALRIVAAEEDRYEDEEEEEDEEGEEEDDDAGEFQDQDFDIDENDPDGFFRRQQRREARRKEQRRKAFWERHDEIRRTALMAAEKVAGRMDELMTAPPFLDNAALHRLRGMLALYVGDLSVPALLEEKEKGEDGRSDVDEYGEDEDINVGRRNSGGIWGKFTDRRLLERQRRVAHERGLAKRLEERARARKEFQKAQKDGGRVDWILVGLDDDGDEIHDTSMTSS